MCRFVCECSFFFLAVFFFVVSHICRMLNTLYIFCLHLVSPSSLEKCLFAMSTRFSFTTRCFVFRVIRMFVAFIHLPLFLQDSLGFFSAHLVSLNMHLIYYYYIKMTGRSTTLLCESKMCVRFLLLLVHIYSC